MIPLLKIHDPPMENKKPRVRNRTIFKPHHAKVLRAFSQRALTDEELMLLFGVGTTNARNRRNELTKMGLLAHSGYTRKSSRGYSAIVWVITNAGREKLTELSRKGKK